MPLTAEEKKRRKLEKKAQKQREAEERRIKTRKDELARELGASEETVTALRKRWYSQNYAARFPHILQDMEVARHSFEYVLDVKDFIISEMLDKHDEARMQEAMAWQDYTLKVDDMISDYQKRVEEQDMRYQEDLKALLDKASNASQAQSKSQADLVDYYKTILFMMEQQFNESSIVAQGEYVTKRDEEAKKGAHNIELMSAALERTLHRTVAALKNTLDEYKEDTESRRKEVESLKAKDDYYSDMIKRQDTRMAKLCEELMSLQSQVNEKHETRLVLDDLKKDREETYSQYRSVRTSLNTDTALDNSRLLALTSHSNDVIQDLERIVEKGEKILQLGALCRRLETQEEKVFPFGGPVDVKPEEPVQEEDNSNPFFFFWRKYASVHLVKCKLEAVLDTLNNENKDLRDCLQTTFEIMSLTRL